MKKLVNFNNKQEYNYLWLNELDRFLQTQGAFSVIKLHGFLTAISSSPDMILPSLWLPLSKIQAIDFESEKQATDIMQDIMLIYNNINITLREQIYKPILYIPPVSHKNSASHEAIWEEMRENIKLWATGYWIGVEATWPFKGNIEFNHEIHFLLRAIYSSTLSKQKFIKECRALNLTTKKYYHFIMECLPEIVMELYNFWLTKREKHSPKIASFVTNDFKLGRNDLCSCGSGKKFKTCCLH